MKRVCVFCASRTGESPKYVEQARLVGETLLSHNLDLVYGGASVGLMGVIADTVLEGGGKAYGIIPRLLEGREVAHRNLTELKVVESMHDRKLLMYEMSDAFLVLPGGIGTLDEFFEIYTWRQLLYHEKPIGLLNVDGFYDHLIKHMDYLTETGFLEATHRNLVVVSNDITQLLLDLKNLS